MSSNNKIKSIQASSLLFPYHVKFNLLFLAIGKLAMVTLSRCFYPYTVYFTDVFEVSPDQYSWILFAGEASAFTVVVTGNFVDVLGSKLTSVLCMLLLSLAAFLTLSRSFVVILFARSLIGLSRNTMTAAIQTYISEHVPPSSLGRITGAMELSWGLGGLLGLPLVGFLLGYGWRVPFFVLGSIFLPLVFFEVCCPANPPTPSSPLLQARVVPQAVVSALAPRTISVRDMLTQNGGVAMCLLLWVGLQVFAVNLLFANYGRWFIEDYDLTRTQLGAATSVVGFGEIGAELTVMLLSDKLGRSRMCLLCTGLTMLSFAGLVLIGNFGAPLSVSICFLFLCFLFFETGLVSAFSIPSTLVQTRVTGRFLGMFFGMLPVGGSISALVAQSLWSQGGLPLTAMASFVASTLGFIVLIPVYLRNDAPIIEVEGRLPTETSALKL